MEPETTTPEGAEVETPVEMPMGEEATPATEMLAEEAAQ